MSASVAPATTDRSDFRTVMVSGTKMGALTAAAVVLFLVVARFVPGTGGARRGDADAHRGPGSRGRGPARHRRAAGRPATGAAGRDGDGVHDRPGGARRRRPRPEVLERGGTVPRWLAHLFVVLGWLVTPVLTWGASYAGLWLGALVATRFSRPLTMLVVAGLGAALLGFAALWTWVRFMSRLPTLLSHHMAPRPWHEYTAVAAAD